MASSSSSADPKPKNPTPTQNPTPKSNPNPNAPPPPPSSSSKPLPSSPSPTPSPPPPTYTTQPRQLNLPSKSTIPPPQISKSQDPQPILYPVASSGRGFIPKASFRPQSPDRVVNQGGFPPRSVRNYGFPAVDTQAQSYNLMRPPMMHPSQFGPRPTPMMGGPGAPVKGTPPILHPKAAALFPSSTPDFNGYRDPRDTSRDDPVITVNDRKVRLSDGDSLYALCRSWVRNGYPKETQPQFIEGLKVLPKPLPATVTDRNGSGDEDEDKDKEEDIGSVEHLSARELLMIHVKRAKRVRARLRKERLRRIERYKQRLTLLLPPQEQQYRNETNRTDANGS